MHSIRATAKVCEELINTLACPVCNTTFSEPQFVGTCGDIVCKFCWSSVRDKCPVCHLAVANNQLLPDTQLQNIVLKALHLREIVGEYLQRSELTSPTTQVVNMPPKRALAAAQKSSDAIESKRFKGTATPNAGGKDSSSLSRQQMKQLNKRNKHGETPLHTACVGGKTDLVRELLGKGADPNTKDNAGWTPLHEAANNGYVEIAELLLASGAIVDAAGLEGVTPLHDAVREEQPQLVQILLAHAADPNLADDKGNSAISLATSPSIQKLLADSVKSRGKPEAIVKPMQRSSEANASDEATSGGGLSGSGGPSNDRIMLIASGFRSEEMSVIKRCAHLLNATLEPQFTPAATHLITPCDNQGIEACLAAGERVKEDLYEIKGCRQFPNNFAPKRARENRQKHLPSLFAGFRFCFAGEFTNRNAYPSNDDLAKLIRLAEGEVLDAIPDELLPPTNPFHVAQRSVLAKSPYVAITESKNSNMLNGPVSRTRDWLIDSISTFSLIPL